MAKLGATERNTRHTFCLWAYRLAIDYRFATCPSWIDASSTLADTKGKANAKAASSGAGKYATLISGRAKTLFELNSVSIYRIVVKLVML